MERKKTSVEYVFEQLYTIPVSKLKELNLSELSIILKYARRMHKNEIMDAHEDGDICGGTREYGIDTITPEQYYNEKYGK